MFDRYPGGTVKGPKLTRSQVARGHENPYEVVLILRRMIPQRAPSQYARNLSGAFQIRIGHWETTTFRVFVAA